MFEECFAMIELEALADLGGETRLESEISFSELTTILVSALEEALFDLAEMRPASIH